MKTKYIIINNGVKKIDKKNELFPKPSQISKYGSLNYSYQLFN